ncbi:MAG: hypothetical protein EXR93_03980 [Gemmatimonadetes bacterium]|nr:hypothetical protein [Gemmatimonadota bacterium]
MTTPAAAIAWEFRRRHRWGLVAIAVLMCALVALKVLVRAKGFPTAFDDGLGFALMATGPFTFVFIYFLAVFTFGLDGDLAARQSMFPARMLTRPVTTAALAGWPMLYAASAVALLWLAFQTLGTWPPSVQVPVIWPGILAVAHIGWTQALTWMPYGLRGVRVFVVMLWLVVIDATVLVAIEFRLSEPVMAAILLPLIPLAWVAGRSAVARARRGDVPDWSGGFTWLANLAGASRPRAHFESPASAQSWFEWRRNGWPLPVWVAILLPLELLLLWIAGPSISLVVVILLGAGVTPVVMATFGALTVSKAGGTEAASYALSPFIAARPLTNAQLITAKLKMTMWSTALAWLLVLIAIPLGLELSGEMPLFVDRLRRLAGVTGTPRVAVFLLLVVAWFAASTWKQLVQSLYIGLTGREWLIKGTVFGTLAVMSCLGPLAIWIVDSSRVGAVWSALPVVFAVLVCLKMIAAAWIVVRLYRERLVRDRTLVIGAASWCIAVFGLYGVLRWFLDTPHVGHYLLMLLAILAIPLARLSAAPLALAWNRHR